MSGKDYSAKLANLANYDIWNFAVVKAEIPGSLHWDIDMPADRWLRILCLRKGAVSRGLKHGVPLAQGTPFAKGVIPLPYKARPRRAL